jgi:hypothetical protein
MTSKSLISFIFNSPFSNLQKSGSEATVKQVADPLSAL